MSRGGGSERIRRSPWLAGVSLSEVWTERVDLRLVQRIQERQRTAWPIAVGGLVAPDQAAEWRVREVRLHAPGVEVAQV